MDSNGKRWWEQSVGYIINPSSFKDGNGDGLGDLPGLIEKLPYLAELGVNLLWLCPIFDSPMDDNGYDVRDYYKVNPLYGANDDLKAFLDKAHSLGIKIVLDLAMNHTSDEHPWFQAALRDPDSPYRAYYLIRKGRYVNGRLLPPSNWKNFLGESCWERIPDTDDFYFHLFTRKMPDTDWSNEAVRREYAAIANHYLSLGVDGFRLDAVSHLAKDLSFRDSSLPPDASGLSYDEAKFSNRPELLGYLREFKDSLQSEEEVLLIGEAGGNLTPEKALPLVDRQNGPLSLIFNSDTVYDNGSYEALSKRDDEIRTDVRLLRENISRWYAVCHANADLPFYWCNHDHPRLVSQYGDVEHREKASKMLCNLLLFMYGTPFVYQGDELGMANMKLSRAEDYFIDRSMIPLVDSYRKEGHSEEEIVRHLNRTARLHARTAFPWGKGPNASFSDVSPQVPLNPEYLSGINLEEEMPDAYSIVNFWQFAILYRRRPIVNDLVLHGHFRWVDDDNPDVLAFLHIGSFRLATIANMRPYEVRFPFYYDIADIPLHNYGHVQFVDHVFTLRPYETYTLQIR